MRNDVMTNVGEVLSAASVCVNFNEIILLQYFHEYTHSEEWHQPLYYMNGNCLHNSMSVYTYISLSHFLSSKYIPTCLPVFLYIWLPSITLSCLCM